MKNLLLIMLASLSLVAMPFTASANEEVDDIFMDEGSAIDDVPPADGGDVAGPTTEETEPEAAPAPVEKPKQAAKPVEKAEKPVKKAEAPVPKKEKARKTASTKGGFKVLKSDCELHAEPSNDSPVLVTSKSSKKLWVEEQNEGWVKGFHKGGEGYFSRNCFE